MLSGASPRFEPQCRPQRRQEGSPVALAALVRGLKMKLGERAGEHAHMIHTSLTNLAALWNKAL